MILCITVSSTGWATKWGAWFSAKAAPVDQAIAPGFGPILNDVGGSCAPCKAPQGGGRTLTPKLPLTNIACRPFASKTYVQTRK